MPNGQEQILTAPNEKAVRVFNYAPRHDGVGRSGGIVSSVLNLGT